MMFEQDQTIVEIAATLEQIQRANQMLAYHKQFKEIDENAVGNFERLRTDFLKQLTVLMKELDIDAQFNKR